MGSASRESLAKASSTLTAGLQASTGPEVLQAAGRIEANLALAAALGDALAPAEGKTALVEKVFGSLGADARGVLSAAVIERWSNPAELVAGIEELGVRASALAQASLVDELLAVADVVSSDHELELTIGSKLLAPEAKLALVEKLLGGKISAEALAVTQQIVANPRGRRVESALRQAAGLAADQGGSELATVTVAAPLTDEQSERLQRVLEKSAGRPVKITTVIDPSLVGGVHVQLAADVIDGSVRARLEDLRQQLAA